MSLLHTFVCRAVQQFLRLRRTLTPAPRQEHLSGEDAVARVPDFLRSRRLKKPLLLVRPSETDLLLRLTRPLTENDIAFSVWDTVPDVPDAEDAENIRLFWLGEGCDCIIALGPEPVMHLARVAALRYASPEYSVRELMSSGRVPEKRIPAIITIPTVPGSGVESCSTAALCPDGRVLKMVVHRTLRPACVVSDPKLLDRATPEQIAAACALGLCHAFESYLSPYAGKKTQFYVLRAIQYYFDTLEDVWKTGGTIAERKLLLEASYLSGQASAAVSFGYVTALVQALAGLTDVTPGDAICALLPRMLTMYGTAAWKQIARMALFTELGQDNTDEELTRRVILRLRTLFFRIGLADTIHVPDPAVLSAVAARAAVISTPRWAAPVVWTAQELEEALLAAI